MLQKRALIVILSYFGTTLHPRLIFLVQLKCTEIRIKNFEVIHILTSHYLQLTSVAKYNEGNDFVIAALDLSIGH